MRHLGRVTPAMRTIAGDEALREAAVHQATGSALAAVNTVGIDKGIYRFKTHEQANAHAQEGLVRAIALNVAARKATASRK